jgi:hypothetical protein
MSTITGSDVLTKEIEISVPLTRRKIGGMNHEIKCAGRGWAPVRDLWLVDMRQLRGMNASGSLLAQEFVLKNCPHLKQLLIFCERVKAYGT